MDQTIEEIRLGDTYRDKVTGFEGVVTARAEYLYEPDRVQLEPLVPGTVDQISDSARWFVATRCERVGA